MVPMRVLILGGSWRLGRLVAAGGARRGFDVTVFNLGRGKASLPGEVRHTHGDRDRDEDLRAIAAAGPWDAVIDISGKVPATVQRSARVLAKSAGRYVSVSSVLAYRNWPAAPVDEGSSLRPGDPGFDPGTVPWDHDTYGDMKVGCELACRDAFRADRLLILRLHDLLGQHEDVGPLLWWLRRMRRGGPVLVPGPDRAIQPVDVRDVSRFLLDLLERGTTGTFNVAASAPGRTFSALVGACAKAAAVDPPELVWVDESWLTAQGVEQWTELPLWRSAEGAWKVSNARAGAAGLRCRPLLETAADIWHWLSTGDRRVDHPRITRYGMDPDREADLIARWRAIAPD